MAGPVSLLLTQGLTLEHLKGLAREFHGNYADLSEPDPWSEPLPVGAAAAAVIKCWPEVERLLEFSRNGAGDPLYDHVTLRGVAVQALGDSPPDGFNYYRQVARLSPISTTRGSQSNWSRDPETGKNACTAIKDLLRELQEGIESELEVAQKSRPHGIGSEPD